MLTDMHTLPPHYPFSSCAMYKDSLKYDASNHIPYLPLDFQIFLGTILYLKTKHVTPKKCTCIQAYEA
jgi:hypothetical protein